MPSTVAGAVPVDIATDNVLATLDLLAAQEIPVHRKRPPPFGQFPIDTTSQLREFSLPAGVDGYDLADGLAMVIALDPTIATSSTITLDAHSPGRTTRPYRHLFL